MVGHATYRPLDTRKSRETPLVEALRQLLRLLYLTGLNFVFVSILTKILLQQSFNVLGLIIQQILVLLLLCLLIIQWVDWYVQSECTRLAKLLPVGMDLAFSDSLFVLSHGLFVDNCEI